MDPMGLSLLDDDENDHGNPSRDPPQGDRKTPQEIAGLIFRDYENPLVSLNKAGY